MGLLVKVIKPRRFNSRLVLNEIVAAQRVVARQAKADFEKTVATWKKKPDFEVLTEIDGQGNVVVLVGTDNPIYRYVDEGTERRDIRPRSGNKRGLLVFPSGYSPATVPRYIGSYPAGTYGPLVFTPIVRDHSIKPRKFTETIVKKWKPKYRRALERALAQGTKQAWALKRIVG